MLIHEDVVKAARRGSNFPFLCAFANRVDAERLRDEARAADYSMEIAYIEANAVLSKKPSTRELILLYLDDKIPVGGVRSSPSIGHPLWSVFDYLGLCSEKENA